MTRPLNRRQSLKILGAALALPGGILSMRGLGHPAELARWSGETLGGLSNITLWHPDKRIAERAIAQMLAEVDRLEDIFSLYRPDSEISRLNREGRLGKVSPDLQLVLDHSQQIAQSSEGAFDPTIQPLWRFYASGPTDLTGLDRVLRLVDYTAIFRDRNNLRLGQSGMAISLNGIAQGYITDRITELLGNQGFENAMIELGETRALGVAPDGLAFSVGILDPASPSQIQSEISLSNAALSVSGGYGTTFNRLGADHIFDPHNGQSPHLLRQVAVIAPKAIWADALSTAIYVAGEGAARQLLATKPGARAILYRNDGTLVHC
jgi:thiamine biosynthesis lipoprotein